MLQCLPKNCQDLRKINLEGCHKLENRSLKYFVKCKKLSHLNFSHCYYFQDCGIIFLADGLPEIKSINLDGISLTDRGVKGLVDSHYLFLEEVELDGGEKEISDVGLEQLSRCKQLKHLGISFCECLTDQSLEYLKELKNLVYLRLSKGRDFSSDGLSSFFKEASLSKLRVLNLSECIEVNDQVVSDMLQANMENLDLSGIGSIYGECLLRVPEEMTKLKFLDLRLCRQILDNLIDDIVQRKKDLKIEQTCKNEYLFLMLCT
ncbi:dynein regulatory complex subunit 6-like isoform X2 [Mercenaria mercenaria]|uniref:dynein regulatory complex subunit 6-like isoform X2 n=1 Tax=Mercenaria mercenaria TaxID=6596 RepID=UPI00234ECF3B|nr:dynein regulatory complex subunit 6-like isoform X2 [Mercenaria mercenaria]